MKGSESYYVGRSVVLIIELLKALCNPSSHFSRGELLSINFIHGGVDVYNFELIFQPETFLW